MKNVFVGMSGGVDSSVTALLLKRQGYKVTGVFMHNWEDTDQNTPCTAEQDYQDALSVAHTLDIPLKTVNFSKTYWDRVFTHFLDEYAAGRTPNPDILCNKEIKFKAFLDYALNAGAKLIATGHYARNVRVGSSQQLQVGLDLSKDQSYFLYTLGQRALKHALFPLGECYKKDIRALAKEAGFKNHNKKDSVGICFIGERHFKSFLKNYLLAQPGSIETVDGHIIGTHEGLMYYTLGQRKGIGIGGLRESTQKPWYVVSKDLERRALIVAQEHDHPLLLSDSLVCEQLHWVSGNAPIFPVRISAKTRYRQPSATCTLTALNSQHCHVRFAQPQWAITPGQSIVFYDGDVCLGGGIITSN